MKIKYKYELLYIFKFHLNLNLTIRLHCNKWLFKNMLFLQLENRSFFKSVLCLIPFF